MLLLLTVGLLLIGLVSLVIGFLNSSLALDYISIAASALSFTLVLLFTRLGRARSARTGAAGSRQAPAPLAQSPTGVIDLDSTDYLDSGPATSPGTQRNASTGSAAVEPTSAYDFEEPDLDEEEELRLEDVDEADGPAWEPEPPAPTAGRPAGGRSPYERPSSPLGNVPPPPPPAAPPPPPVPPGRSPVTAGRSGDDPYAADRYADQGYEGEGEALLEEEAYDDLEFPIADYDELRVGELLPLLAELEPDEIDAVREREMSGRNRAVVLHRLDELSGVRGAPRPGGPVSGGALSFRPPAPAPPPAAPRPSAASEVNGTRRPAGAAPRVEAGYDDEAADYGQDYDDVAEEGYEEEAPRDKGDAFPIADYDDLRLTEVLPLLPRLEPGELEMVRQRELQGERRATLLNRIDALIGTRSPRATARPGR